MKKLILMVCVVGVLASCSSSPIKEDYSDYKDKSSLQLLQSAEHHLAKNKNQDAIKELEAMDAIYPFGPHSKQAQRDAIYAYYKADDKPSAAAAAERYIRLYPRDQHVDYAYYMLGLIQYEQGFSWLQKAFKVNPASSNLEDKKEAFSAFKTLVDSYPRSPYSADAVVRMNYIRNLFAEHELMIAQYYMTRKAYVAAANRASEVVVHYQHSPSVEGALAVMVKAYRTLQLDKQADNALAILKASYPHSSELKNLG